MASFQRSFSSSFTPKLELLVSSWKSDQPQSQATELHLDVKDFVFLHLGPYMLGTGLLVYMLSKEIYVINHETFAAASIGAVIIYGVKKFGPQVAAFADKLNEVG